MTTSTAEDLYELAKKLPVNERLRLVEKIAHDLTGPAAPRVSAMVETRVAGQVTDIALDPPRFTVKTARGPVVVRASVHLLDAVRAAWGCESIVTVNAAMDPDGTIDDAEAVTIEVCSQVDDALATFEATFGSGHAVWSSPEGREHLETMRGGGS